jgi:hypothetical protein
VPTAAADLQTKEIQMAYELPKDREIRDYDTICEQFRVVGRYELFMKRNWTNQNTSFRTVNVRDRESGACESYYADAPLEIPRYWLKRFSYALEQGTFGSQSPEAQAKADRRYRTSRMG